MHRQLFWVAMAVVACLALQAARKDFWEVKDASSWSDQEKQVLLAQSPWARQGFARMELENQRTGPGYTGPGYTSGGRPDTGMPDAKPSAQAGGHTSVAIGEEVPPVPDPRTGPPVRLSVLARWETAKPVRLAGGPEVPEEARQFYVIRLIGLPFMPPPKAQPGEVIPDPNAGMLQAIRQSSRLERIGKPDIHCAHVFVGSGDSSHEVLLFFPRGGANPITVGDKSVTLDSRFAPFHLSVKFSLKEMVYKGELSL